MDATAETVPDSIGDAGHDGQISETVVTMVADATGVDPLDLDPLYDVVDPDALDSIVRPTGGSPPSSLEVHFTMGGCQVLVSGDGQILVTPPGETDVRSTTVAARTD